MIWSFIFYATGCIAWIISSITRPTLPMWIQAVILAGFSFIIAANIGIYTLYRKIERNKNG
jgi:hypothetical protein